MENIENQLLEAINSNVYRAGDGEATWVEGQDEAAKAAAIVSRNYAQKLLEFVRERYLLAGSHKWYWNGVQYSEEELIAKFDAETQFNSPKQ